MNDKVIAIYKNAPNTNFLSGSGFLIDNKIILTATHVIKENEKIIPRIFGSVLINNKPTPLELSYIKSISNTDISILKITNGVEVEKNNLPFFNIGKEYSAGDDIAICGFPAVFFDKKGNHIPSLFPMIRGGIISSLYEKIETNIIVLDIMGLNGFSGSPILHKTTNKVIAVFSKISAPGNYNTGFSIAYPIKKEYIENI